MPSPFPGLDPFLESQLWSDFHSRFIAHLSEALVVEIRPRYVAVIEERVYVEHEPEQPRLWVRPDVTVVKQGTEGRAADGEPQRAPHQVLLSMPEIRETFIEIRLRDGREVVAVIELLSPANKRANSEGRREYLSKRAAVLRGGVHLVELDFLRGGERLPVSGQMPPGDGYAIVSDARRRPMADVWPLSLREPLPVIQVPLTGDDPSVPVNLQAVFADVYERAGYDYALDYTRPLEPSLTSPDGAWLRERLQER